MALPMLTLPAISHVTLGVLRNHNAMAQTSGARNGRRYVECVASYLRFVLHLNIVVYYHCWAETRSINICEVSLIKVLR